MNDLEKTIAVIGAGVSGLSAACLLSRAGFRVRIFEKSRGVSGRAASRTREGCRYDHGANYFTVEETEVHHWIFEELSSEGLVEIDGAILPFDSSGTVGVPDETRDGRAKYSYRDGISTLGKKMRERFDLDIVHGERITGLGKRPGHAGWILMGEKGRRYGEYGAVLVSTPLAQAIPMLEASDFDEKLQTDLRDSFDGVRYYSQYSVVLNFSEQQHLPKNAYALINEDRAHAVAWISNEGFKTGHVPAGESLYVVQMSPHWSSEREGWERTEIAEQVLRQVSVLFDNDLPRPGWSDVQWWKFAHPQPGGKIYPPETATGSGLYFAGDAFVGKGRVAGALKSGFEVAREIISRSGP
ncbi:MAG: FAD-dependent oxidoreductase [Verrucomicrobiales bacterium]|nr:FAD-dependent oxidoreductase [Verrucomicrobiales bacterium]